MNANSIFDKNVIEQIEIFSIYDIDDHYIVFCYASCELALGFA